MADLRSELSEMRNTNQELREAKMELQVELRQYRADDRVRERDLNQLLLLSSVSPWSCASPVAIPSRADPAVMSSGGATADGSSGHAYGMFNTTYGRAERLNPCILCCRPRQEKFSFSISCFTLFLLLLFMWIYRNILLSKVVCVCVFGQKNCCFSRPWYNPCSGTLTRLLYSFYGRFFLYFTTARTLPRNGTYGSTGSLKYTKYTPHDDERKHNARALS